MAVPMAITTLLECLRILSYDVILLMAYNMHTPLYYTGTRTKEYWGAYHEPVFTGTKRRLVQKQDHFQYIPLLSSLKSLLSDVSIPDEVEQCSARVHTDGIIEDVCDGKAFKAHPMFSGDPYALQIIAFYDELELCNPLGTHVKKHKLAIVLYALGNIRPILKAHLVTAAAIPILGNMVLMRF